MKMTPEEAATWIVDQLMQG